MRYFYRPTHPKANERGFVSALDLDEYEPQLACNAPVMVDRFRENTVAPDGTDIGTRAKERAWMKETGTAHYEDFKGAREKRQAELEAKKRGETKPDKALRDLIGREMYKRKMII